MYYWKHFYSILTNLSNLSHSKSSIVPFAKFRSDVINVLRKHFPTTFANVLQNRSSYKFPNICKIIPVLESLFNKDTRLTPCNFIKKLTPEQVFSCKYHKMFENGFLYGTPPVTASENGWIISQLEKYCTEEFIKVKDL